MDIVSLVWSSLELVDKLILIGIVIALVAAPIIYVRFFYSGGNAWVSDFQIGIRDKSKESRRQYYNRYMRSSDWRVNRSGALARDGYRCSMCGSRNVLQVHHKSYRHFGKERDNELVTLCKACHQATHGRNF